MAQTEILLVCEKEGDLPTLLTDEIKQKLQGWLLAEMFLPQI